MKTISSHLKSQGITVFRFITKQGKGWGDNTESNLLPNCHQDKVTFFLKHK